MTNHTGRSHWAGYIPFLVISCVLLLFIRMYYTKIISDVESDVTEHARVLTEPLWNYDHDIIDGFFKAIILRQDYESIGIYDADHNLFHEVLAPPQTGIPLLLTRLGILTTRTFTANIIRDTQTIGSIVVEWRNNTPYVFANALLVAVLLFIITNLYRRIIATNRALETKINDLHDALEEVKKQKEYIEHIFHVVPQGLITIGQDMHPLEWNTSFRSIIDRWAQILDRPTDIIQDIFIVRLQKELQKAAEGTYTMNIDGQTISMSFASTKLQKYKNVDKVVSLRDVTDVATMQRRLSQAEKLESVGRLAAGIAHEINTPTQYTSTNIAFLAEAYDDLARVMTRISQLTREVDRTEVPDILTEMNQVLNDADWEFLETEIPQALEQSQEGLQRIQSIVSAMKRFSHPAGENAEMCNINQAIETTVTIARNEWKYVAEMQLELDPNLPAAPCFIDQFNQVLLIMIINSAHAIEDLFGETEEKMGKITLRTEATEHDILISCSDNGAGMADEVRQRIFDPFFTTKEVNKGTGQGLTIANDIITNKHHGSIDVQSEPGVQTTFIIRLPRESATP